MFVFDPNPDYGCRKAKPQYQPDDHIATGCISDELKTAMNKSKQQKKNHGLSRKLDLVRKYLNNQEIRKCSIIFMDYNESFE